MAFQCVWLADILLNPTRRNLEGSFEEWSYRRGMLPAIQRLEAKGWVESRRRTKGTGRVHRLTEKGVLRAIGGRHPEHRWDREWDGLWRMVVFDVPEQSRSMRHHLRRRLREAGFGCLQGSVWIRPDPLEGVAEELRRIEIDCARLTFWEGATCGGESVSDVVGAAWNLKKLAVAHQSYLQHLRKLPSPEGDPDPLLEWCRREQDLWEDCMRLDPLLPRALCPRDYAGEKAWRRKLDALRRVQAGLRQTVFRP